MQTRRKKKIDSSGIELERLLVVATRVAPARALGSAVPGVAEKYHVSTLTLPYSYYVSIY
jgi:hypothetical protein